MAAQPHVTRRPGALAFSGPLRMDDVESLWSAMRHEAAASHEKRLDLDLKDVSFIDGAVMALLVELRDELAAQGVESNLINASPRVQPLVHLYRGDAPPAHLLHGERPPILELFGDAVARWLHQLRLTVEFVGDLLASCGTVLWRPSAGNFQAVPYLSARAGADGVPIVLLLNLLLGFVMGFQSAQELELYGANIYVAQLVGISVTRELAPLMTAIIMSGRSGASYAAELGTMGVSQEIDALRVLGFDPMQFLVMPRVIALVLVAPALTLLGDVVGVAGGAIVGVLSLDVSLQGYLGQLRVSVLGWDVLSGLIKSAAFALCIALIGCEQGFATTGAAAGVGRSTTATVVYCLFTIVIVDTLFTVLFRMLHV